MELNETVITKAIIEKYYSKLLDARELQVALVGGGPANLVCGYYLGKAGIKTALFESKLAPGGGMWGGGMMFNEIVVQKEATQILDLLDIPYSLYEDDYYTLDSVLCSSMLIEKCISAGTKIFNLIKAVDVMFRKSPEKKVSGLVIQWTPVDKMGLHVDPVTIQADYVVDGTGHPAEICTVVTKKMDAELKTETGGVVGEKSMSAEDGEKIVVTNSKEVYPGLYVTGMAANAVCGSPRMGPVFGGMLLSGMKVAKELITRTS